APRRRHHAPARPRLPLARRRVGAADGTPRARPLLRDLDDDRRGDVAGEPQHRRRARARPAEGPLMDFELTDDQVALQEGVRAFLDGRFSLDDVRAIETAGHLDRDRWRELGETGVFSITLPEADGGLELGVSEAVLVFEELGRALVPGPLVATFLAAPWIDRAPPGGTIVSSPQPGTPVSVVEHPADLDALFTLAPDGVRRLDPAAIATRPVERPVDALTPLGIVGGDVPAGEVIADAEAAERARL